NGACGDHDAAHHQRAENAPREHAVLHGFRHLEGAENYQKDEQVVYAERFFDDIACEVFKATLLAVPVPDAYAEDERRRNPKRAAEGRFGESYFVGFTVEDAQIEGQCEKNK